MNHIFINFLPGSCGNFLTRFLQCIISNSYCWLNRSDSSNTFFQTFDDKLKLLDNYSKNINKTSDWVKFENKLAHFNERVDISSFNVELDPVLIWISHIWTLEKIKKQNLVGPNDQHTLIQITYDNKSELEWIVLNCLYKDSYIEKHFFDYYQHNTKTITNNVDYFPISNFMNWQNFKNGIKNILDNNNINYNSHDIEKLENFYNNWYNTTLKFSEFDDFKKSIGWLL